MVCESIPFPRRGKSTPLGNAKAMNPAGRTTLVFFLVPLASWLLLLCLPHLTEADTDVGHIAVVETDATILQPGELFDLNGKTITFTPKAGGGYKIDIGALNFDSRIGVRTSLGLNSSGFIDLPFVFPFFGVNQTTVFVNSNGRCPEFSWKWLVATDIKHHYFSLVNQFSRLCAGIFPSVFAL